MIDFDLHLTEESQKELDGFLSQWAALTESLIAPMHQQGGDIIMEAFEENFIEGDSRWAPLSELTNYQRERQGFQPDHPILIRTGSFLSSVINRSHPLHFEQTITEKSGFEFVFGSDDPRFDILHFGGTNYNNSYVPPEWLSLGVSPLFIGGKPNYVPGRPFLFLQGEQEERLFDTLSSIVIKKLGLE